MGLPPAVLVLLAALAAGCCAQQQMLSAAGVGGPLPRSQQLQLWSQRRQLLHGSLVHSARSALPDPQQAGVPPAAECEPVAVRLSGLKFWESVPVPSTLLLNCSPSSGESLLERDTAEGER